jgi:glutamyl-tRNA(Gln) amidotransferase subunit E
MKRRKWRLRLGGFCGHRQRDSWAWDDSAGPERVVANGALIENKGVQEIDLISTVVEFEVQRQLGLIAVKDELAAKGITPQQITENITDVTPLFKETKSKVIRKAIDRNQAVKALKLPGFAGFLKRELMPNFRVGTELSDRAKFWGRVGGIFHTDEMPNYGVTLEEVAALRQAVSAAGGDAVVFVADTSENTTDALKAVAERARELLMGVPQETRTAKEDGTTRYMRPRPGAARMYPETDIPAQIITAGLVEKIRVNLPESAEKKQQRLAKQYGLNPKLAKQIIDSEYSSEFDAIVKETGIAATAAAVFLTETLKSLKRDGVQTENVSDPLLKQLFVAVGSGAVTKEALPDVFTWLSKNVGKTVSEAADALGLKMLPREDLEQLVDRVIAANKPAIEKLGKGAFGLVMGQVMKEARGKASPELVSQIVKQKL